MDSDEFLVAITKKPQPAFGHVKLKLGDFYATSIVYLAETNTSNIKYYFVIEKIKYAQFPPIKRECLTSKLMATHSTSALNCTTTMMLLIENLNSSKKTIGHLKDNIDEIARFSYSNLRIFRNIEIYSTLDDASSFNMQFIDLIGLLDTCVDNVNLLAGSEYSKNRDTSVRFESKVKLTPKKALKDYHHHDLNFICVRVDTQMLLIALNEIIANAYKFSHNNINVALIIRIENDSVYIVCSDEGIGFDNSALPDPFAPFAKSHRLNVSNDNVGLGLGLSIAKRIINYFDGDITYSNHTNKPGANVTVRLPIASNFDYLTFYDAINKDGDGFPHSTTCFANIFNWRY